MDPAWPRYSMSSLRFGKDAGVDPQQLALRAQLQANDKNVCAKMHKYMFQLKYKTANGEHRSAGTGFYPLQGKKLGATAAHIQSGAKPNETIVAFNPAGAVSDVKDMVCSPTAGVAIYTVDKACEYPIPAHNTAELGDTVYLFGFFQGRDELDFTKGMVTSASAGVFTTTGYADHGFSGGPVFNAYMELVGMVMGGAGFVQGIANQQARCMTINKLAGFLQGVMAVRPTLGD